MTEGQKQEILHMLQALYDIHEKIAGALQQQEMVRVQELLLECQECGIHIGNRIEASCGEGFVTVSCLEAYCECVYQIYAGQCQAQEAEGVLNESLDCVKESIRKDIAVRKEVVFLPYKASMWDSLESVWRKKNADPECDVYVIPIPYYDKNPDGSFHTMYYEGDNYPDYVEVTDYKSYCIKERRPDEIYIHNPYDGVNCVTSVPTEFYASNLKKYTDKLVYIPYFVLEEIEPDDREKIETMKHFCLLPGVLHATQVIVQSENMRQIYINELMAAFQQQGNAAARKYWENKIRGNGSPKLIKAQDTRKEEVELPADWLNIIQKSDGTWKNVVFYNTGVNALVHYGERLLEKIEEVFEIFKEQREDIAFLWRPHPLMKSTILAQKPRLLEWYDRIEAQYWEEGWGIYDDTADLNRAVALSDVYYGDESSVQRLFEENKKKVIIQNVDVCRVSAKHLIGVYDIVGQSGKKYFASKYRNALFCYDGTVGEVEFLQKFQTEKEEFLYLVGHESEGLVFFYPYLADNIAVYDVEQRRLSYLHDDRLREARINRGMEYDKKFYLINESSLAKSFVFDMEKMELFTLQETYGLPEEILERARIRYYKDFCFINTSLYLPGEEPDGVVEFDLANGKLLKHKISDSGMTYATIAYDGRAFYLTGDRRAIVRWDGGKETEMLCGMPNGFDIKPHKLFEGYFACSLYMEGYIYMFPLCANMIIRVDVQSKQIEMVRDGLENVACWYAKKWSEDSVYVEMDNYEGEVIRENFILNLQSGEVRKNILQIGQKEERDKVKKIDFRAKSFVKETTEMEIIDLL